MDEEPAVVGELSDRVEGEPGNEIGLELIAYPFRDCVPLPTEPAPVARDWMATTHDHFAQRCLPLLIANQAGWIIRNSHQFKAHWDGSDSSRGLRLMFMKGGPPYPDPAS